MDINFSELSASQRYHVMTQVIVPRPVAWVLTDNGLDSEHVLLQDKPLSAYNLAPYSYFNAISSEPPLVILSIGNKSSAELKDTRTNLREGRAAVIHIASDEDAALVSQTAAILAHGDSEVARAGLQLSYNDNWQLPRLTCCKIAMLCRFYDEKEIGPHRQGLIFCEIEKVHVDEQVVSMDEKDRIKVDASKVKPLSRLGANEYASFGDIVTLSRPK